MRPTSCYLCGSEKRRPLFRQRGRDPYFEIVFGPDTEAELYWNVCEACGFVYRSPVLEPAELDRLYAGYEKDVFKDKTPDEYFDRIVGLNDAESENAQKTIWLGEVLERHAGSRERSAMSVLDIGCGGGTLLYTMSQKLGLTDACAVELNPAYAELARTRAGVDVRNREYEPGLFGRSFDLVVCTKVLEHVPDPRPFLAAMVRDLAAGGLLFLEVPDVRDAYSLPPEDDRFYIPHIYFFSANTLGALLAEAGLRVVANRVAVTHRNRGYLQIAAEKAESPVAPRPPYDDPSDLAERVTLNLLHQGGRTALAEPSAAGGRKPGRVFLDVAHVKWSPEGVEGLVWPYDRTSMVPVRDTLQGGFVSTVEPHLERGDAVARAARLFGKWFFGESVRLFNAISIKNGFEKCNVDPVVPKRFKTLAALVQGKVPNVLLPDIIMGTRPHYPDRLFLAKKLIREVQWNGLRADVFRPYEPDKHVVTLLPSPMLLDHARCENVFLKYTSLSRMFGETNLDVLQMPMDLKHSTTLASLMDLLENAFRQGGQDFEKWIPNYFAEWFKVAVNFMEYTLGILRRNTTILPKRFWSGSVMATVWLSVVAEAVREQGGKVVVHEHGTDTSHYDQRWHQFVTFAGCDEFHAPNTKSAEVRLAALRPAYFFFGRLPEISAPSPQKRESLADSGPEILTHSGPMRKLLYVATAFHGEKGAMRPYLSDVVYLDWQARLLGFLAERRIEVVVQPHPEGQTKPPSGFAESFGFRTLTGRFEEIELEFDAYLIDFIASSTTAPILRSEKPVIFVDQNSPPLTPEAKALIQKRCWYIPAWDDFENRLQIDWDLLARGLEAAEHVMDMTYARTYLAGH